jgi:hypothetical protein
MKGITFAVLCAALAPFIVATAHGEPVGSSLTIERNLDNVKLTPHEKLLADALGTDDWGRGMRRALIADAHAAEVRWSKDYARDYFLRRLSEPQAGLAEFKKGLAHLSARNFPVERATLIVLIGMLPDQEEEARKIALAEMISPAPAPAQPTGMETALPAAACGVFLDKTSDAELALAGTLQGMKAQSDPAVRGIFANQFARKFPKMAATLRERISPERVP